MKGLLSDVLDLSSNQKKKGWISSLVLTEKNKEPFKVEFLFHSFFHHRLFSPVQICVFNSVLVNKSNTMEDHIKPANMLQHSDPL